MTVYGEFRVFWGQAQQRQGKMRKIFPPPMRIPTAQFLPADLVPPALWAAGDDDPFLSQDFFRILEATGMDRILGVYPSRAEVPVVAVRGCPPPASRGEGGVLSTA